MLQVKKHNRTDGDNIKDISPTLGVGRGFVDAFMGGFGDCDICIAFGFLLLV